MTFNKDQINEIEKNQLNLAEMMILRMLVNVAADDAASALGVSRQYVYATRDRAHAKLKRQKDAQWLTN